MSYWDQVASRVEMGPELPPGVEEATPEALLYRLRQPDTGRLQGASFLAYLESVPEVAMAALFQAHADLGLTSDGIFDAVAWDDEQQQDDALTIIDSLIEGE